MVLTFQNNPVFSPTSFCRLTQPSPLILSHYPPPSLTIHEYLTCTNHDDGADTCADLIVLILDLNAPELHKSRRGRGEATEHSAVDENIVKTAERPHRVSFLLLIFLRRPIAH